MKKQYIVRKYVMASSAAEALRIENKHRADECWVDEKWMEANWKNGDTLGYAKD